MDLVSQSTIRKALAKLGLTVSNSIFWWHKGKGHFPAPDFNDKVSRVALYTHQGAIEVMRYFTGESELEDSDLINILEEVKHDNEKTAVGFKGKREAKIMDDSFNLYKKKGLPRDHW